MKSTALALGLLLLPSLIFPATAVAQPGVTPFSYFPTADVTDGRMIAFACPQNSTFEQPVSFSLGIPADEPDFEIAFFDGDTGGSHWDNGSQQLFYRLYFDSGKTLNTDPANLVAEWYGNAANPLVSPSADPERQWVASSAVMPDNAWWTAVVTNSSQAAAPSGNRFYHLVIGLDGGCPAAGSLVRSDLKIATSAPVSFVASLFAFEASMPQPFNDGRIIYPEWDGTFPLPSDDFWLTTPTTYDGTFEFPFQVAGNREDVTLYDGDFDRGALNTIGFPSGVILDSCPDTDDLDTPANFDGFPASLPTAGASEGAKGPGLIPDDSVIDAFRRGEPGSVGGIGCIRYELIDPNGVLYRNDNPSGNLEFEQFRISSSTTATAAEADYGPTFAADGTTFVSTPTLPGGIWTVRLVGLDLNNLALLYLEGTCSVDGTGLGSCPGSRYVVGSSVFHDLDGDGIQDSDEPGIAGVTLELYSDLGGAPVASTVTGDVGNPNYEACRLLDPATDPAGMYCFGVDLDDEYVVVVADSNFAAGGSLETFVPVAGNSAPAKMAGTNYLDADFGYYQPPPPGVATIGYWKNHPDEWPLTEMLLGAVLFDADEAMDVLWQPPRGDKTIILAKQLIAAKLNVAQGSISTCIVDTIDLADQFLTVHPVGSKLKKHPDWNAYGSEVHETLDDYNNGLLCANHRD